MSNDITQLLLIATAIVPFVNAIVGLIRKSVPSIKANYLPLISLGVGVVIGAVFAYLPNVEYSAVQLALAGGIAGMAACGVFDIAAIKATSATDTNTEGDDSTK